MTQKKLPLIALRPDREFYHKISYLHQHYNTTKTMVIKDSISLLYHSLKCKTVQKGNYCSECGAKLLKVYRR